MSTRYARILAAVVAAAAAGPFGLVLGGAIGFGLGGSIAVAAALAFAAGFRAAGSEPADLATDGMRRGLVALVVAGALVAVTGLAGLGIFIHDASHTALVRSHHGDFGVRHNCFTAYVVGACYVRDGLDDVYDRRRWRDEKDTAIHRSLHGRFGVDMYPYPPTLMALHRGMLALSGDFFTLRRWWYLLVAGTFLLALLRSAAWCGALRSHRALMLVPWVAAAPSALTGLQIQNVHPLVVGAAVLAAIAFRERRTAAGSFLLAGAIVCKIWPAILLVPLAAAGRRRAVAGTLAATATLLAVGVAVLGIDVHRDFVTYQIPRLQSGEAFWFMRESARPIMANASIFSITHKLHEMGLLAADPPLTSPAVGWVYTALVLAAAVLVGLRWRRDDTDDDDARLRFLRTVLALLVLAQLRSPFLPWPYGVITALWLVVFCAPGSGRVRGLALAACFVLLAAYIPFPNGITRTAYWWGIAGTAVMLAAGLAVIPFGHCIPHRRRYGAWSVPDPSQSDREPT